MDRSAESAVRLKVPSAVELDGHLLIADMSSPSFRPATPEVFSRFIRLASAGDTAVLEFARHWGIFGLCAAHRLPAGDPPLRHDPDNPAEYCRPRTLRIAGQDYYAEPLGRWQTLASQAASILRIGVDISTGGCGQERDWYHAPFRSLTGEQLWKSADQEPWRARSRARRALPELVEQWLYLGQIQPGLEWDAASGRWTLINRPASGTWKLFGWLALRLAAEIGGGRWTICPFCQNIYFPGRAPTPGKGHCCSSPTCRRAYFTEYKRKQRSSEKQP